jgi:hypothetical protein
VCRRAIVRFRASRVLAKLFPFALWQLKRQAVGNIYVSRRLPVSCGLPSCFRATCRIASAWQPIKDYSKRYDEPISPLTVFSQGIMRDPYARNRTLLSFAYGNGQ